MIASHPSALSQRGTTDTRKQDWSQKRGEEQYGKTERERGERLEADPTIHSLVAAAGLLGETEDPGPTDSSEMSHCLERNAVVHRMS